MAVINILFTDVGDGESSNISNENNFFSKYVSTDGINREYQILTPPNAFVASSLSVYVNGKRIYKINADGYSLVDDHTIRTNLLYPANFQVLVEGVKHIITNN